jgi:hypothetical protein
MGDIEVFRTIPEFNRCYAIYEDVDRFDTTTRPERLFTNVDRQPIYVGEFFELMHGGPFRIGYNFVNFNDAREVVNNFIVYPLSDDDETKCWREVSCHRQPLPQEHLKAIENRNHVPTLKSLAFSQLPSNTIYELRSNYDNIFGGRAASSNRKSKRKMHRKSKRKMHRKSKRKRLINK